MLNDSHEWVLFCAGRDLGKTTHPLCIAEPHWSLLFQSQLSRALTGKLKRTKAVENAIGYSLDALRVHLERQFSDGMNWGNYAGNNKWRAQNVWVIDHIVPKTLFSKDQSARAFCLSNLRPLWAEQNMRKAARRTHLI